MCLSAFVSRIQYATFFETLPQLRLQELADCNILSETLSPSRLQDKVSRCRLRARRPRSQYRARQVELWWRPCEDCMEIPSDCQVSGMKLSDRAGLIA